MPELLVLFEGYLKILDDGTQDSNSSCVLIKGQKNIIIETMTPWDTEKLIAALATNGLKPEEIDFVVCTSPRGDHVGNNNLFKNALHYIDGGIQKGTIFTNLGNTGTDFQICEGVKILPMRCRNEDQFAVIVQTKVGISDARVAISGDVFQGYRDIREEVIREFSGVSYQVKTNIENRQELMENSDYIIPGRGPIFEITEEMRKVMEENSYGLMRIKHVAGLYLD